MLSLWANWLQLNSQLIAEAFLFACTVHTMKHLVAPLKKSATFFPSTLFNKTDVLIMIIMLTCKEWFVHNKILLMLSFEWTNQMSYIKKCQTRTYFFGWVYVLWPRSRDTSLALTWDGVPKVDLEPSMEGVDRREHLTAESVAVWRDSHILVPRLVSRLIGQQELAWKHQIQ